MHIYQKISDPLLANCHYPQLSKKAYLPQLRPSQPQRGSQSAETSSTVLPMLGRAGVAAQEAPSQGSQKEEDPVKFLQQYFKPKENQREWKPTSSNYVMAKYGKKFRESQSLQQKLNQS